MASHQFNLVISHPSLSALICIETPHLLLSHTVVALAHKFRVAEPALLIMQWGGDKWGDVP